MSALAEASPEVLQAVVTQLWETLEWVSMLCASERSEEYDEKLMSSPLISRMIETAITGDSPSDKTPSNVYMMKKVWIAYSLAPDHVQETLQPLVSMFKRVAHLPQGLSPNDLWIDDDGTVMYPEQQTYPPPPPPPPPPGAQTSTKYPYAPTYTNPPLQQQQGATNMPLPMYPPVTAAEIAQASLDLMDVHGPEQFWG